MIVLSFARIRERADALLALERQGADFARLVGLDNAVRGGRVTDFPGRKPGPESRTAAAWLLAQEEGR